MAEACKFLLGEISAEVKRSIYSAMKDGVVMIGKSDYLRTRAQYIVTLSDHTMYLRVTLYVLKIRVSNAYLGTYSQGIFFPSCEKRLELLPLPPFYNSQLNSGLTLEGLVTGLAAVCV